MNIISGDNDISSSKEVSGAVIQLYRIFRRRRRQDGDHRRLLGATKKSEESSVWDPFSRRNSRFKIHLNSTFAKNNNEQKIKK